MQKDGSIIISGFQKGVAPSALFGAESIYGCDINDEVGVLKIADAGYKDETIGVNTFNPGVGLNIGLTVAKVTNYHGKDGYLTEFGYLFYDNGVSAALAINLTKGWDMCTFNSDFTVVSYSNGSSGSIGIVYHPNSSTHDWHAGKITGLIGNYNIKLLQAQDGYVYFTNGEKIGRITNITYSAGVVTVTSSSNVLDLQKDTFAVTLCELGSDLLIGTQKGASYDNRNSYSFANIYKWDRTSSSFRLPVEVQENGINAMIQKDNRVYFSAGIHGNIYMTDGTNYQKIATLPFTRIKKFGSTCTVYYNAINFSIEGRLLVGVSVYARGDDNTNRYGVYEINQNNQNTVNLLYLPRDKTTGTTSNLSIGFVQSQGYSQVAYSTKQTSGGTTTVETLYTLFQKLSDYTATYESEIFIVGSRKNRKSYQDIEFLFLDPLVSGQGIKISYRKNLYDSWTEIGTWEYSDIGGVISHYDKALIADAEMLQIQIKLTQDILTVFPHNVKLIKVIIS